jgi:hypothetical protein
MTLNLSQNNKSGGKVSRGKVSTHTHTHTHTQTHRHTHTQTCTHNHTHRHTHTQCHTHTHIHTQCHIHTMSHTHTHTHTHTHRMCGCFMTKGLNFRPSRSCQSDRVGAICVSALLSIFSTQVSVIPRLCQRDFLYVSRDEGGDWLMSGYWLLLYAHRHRSILGAAGHIILTLANQLKEE